MEEKVSFLIIDDENAIVISLKALINKTFPDYPVFTAKDGLEGWDIIQLHKPNIVISDITMPGLNGLQLLKKVRDNKELNDLYFIILTANIDRTQRIQALEQGADDFITKPFSSDELLARLRSATRFVSLQIRAKEENKILQNLTKELERTIHDMTLLAVKFLQARMPASTDMLKRVAEASYWIAKQLGTLKIEQLQDIKIAAYLCYSGKVCLPDEVLKMPVLIDGRPSHKLMFQVPTSARDIVGGVKRYKDVATILYHLYENFDGSGFPERLKSWQIPIGSRIIRVALDYEELRLNQQISSKEAIERIKREMNRLYDPKVVVLMDQYIAHSGLDETGVKERAVKLEELQDGMIVSRDIVTISGMKLIPAGAVLRENIIKKIFAHNSSDPILGNIYIKVQ